MSAPEEQARTKHKAASLTRAAAGLQHSVVFDPENAEHIAAFEMLMTHGRQHPTLRFSIEPRYVNVRQMMLEKVGMAYLARVKACDCSH